MHGDVRYSRLTDECVGVWSHHIVILGTDDGVPDTRCGHPTVIEFTQEARARKLLRKRLIVVPIRIVLQSPSAQASGPVEANGSSQTVDTGAFIGGDETNQMVDDPVSSKPLDIGTREGASTLGMPHQVNLFGSGRCPYFLNIVGQERGTGTNVASGGSPFAIRVRLNVVVEGEYAQTGQFELRRVI